MNAQLRESRRSLHRLLQPWWKLCRKCRPNNVLSLLKTSAVDQTERMAYAGRVLRLANRIATLESALAELAKTEYAAKQDSFIKSLRRFSNAVAGPECGSALVVANVAIARYQLPRKSRTATRRASEGLNRARYCIRRHRNFRGTLQPGPENTAGMWPAVGCWNVL